MRPIESFTQPERQELQALYNGAQVSLIKWMIRAEVIASYEEYATGGHAARFRSVALGQRLDAEEVNWGLAKQLTDNLRKNHGRRNR